MSRKQIRLGLDLDGVITDFNTQFVKLSHSMFPKLQTTCPWPSSEWPRSWDYMDEHLEPHEVRQLWDHVIRKSPNFWRTSPVYPWATQLLQIADNKAGLLYFITARAGIGVQAQTAALLAHTYGPCSRGAIICTPNAESKIPIINALNLTHYVDDKKETVRDAHEQCLNTNIGMWCQPWNDDWRKDNLHVAHLTNVEDFESWLK